MSGIYLYKDADNDGYGDSFNVGNRYVSQTDNETVNAL